MSNAGTILIIDLSARTIERIATSGYAKAFIGGAGVAARLFTECVPSDTRAFDEKNMLIFSTGPLTGSLFGNKANVCSRAPEQPNHPYVHCGMGGQLPSEMKFAGYDHIVIKGQSETPVYLSIYNEDVRFVDAGHLWGLDVYKTQAAIRSECRDPDVRVACIGPAGENRVVNALILHDIEHTAARGGMGAVMGAKNLKALAVRGTKGLRVADPKAVRKLWQEYFDYYTKGKGGFTTRLAARRPGPARCGRLPVSPEKRIGRLYGRNQGDAQQIHGGIPGLFLLSLAVPHQLQHARASAAAGQPARITACCPAFRISRSGGRSRTASTNTAWNLSPCGRCSCGCKACISPV
jgi:aldehyde:ferredoxin oxidoreductase